MVWGIYMADMTSLGYFTAGKTAVTFEVPDNFDVNAAEIVVLEIEKDRIQKEAQAKMYLLEERIRNLKCLEAPK